MGNLATFEEYVDQQFPEMVRQLQALCRRPSISAQGVGLRETADAVHGLLRDIGARTRLIEVEGGSPWVYAEVGAGSRRLLFYNHYDVQPPEPLDLWTSPPFAAEIRDGKIFSRGVADNKGDLVARIQAVATYRRIVGELPLRIVFLVEGEEEIGSPHLPRFVDENRQLVAGADGCLWEGGWREESGRLQVFCGLKGICYVELRVRSARRDVHSMWATVVPDAAWRLVWALGTLKDADERITVDDLMEHVAPPAPADLAYLHSIPLNEEQLKADFGIPRFLRDLHGVDLLKKHLYEPTCTVCGLLSGYIGEGTKTVLPSTAMAKVDFRLVPDLTPDLVLELLRRHLDRHGFADVEIVPIAGMNPAKSPLDAPIVEATIDTAREVYGTEPIVYPLMAGSGPMYTLCQGQGVQVASAGVSNTGSNEHAPDENITLEDYRQGIKYIGHLIERFAAM